MKNLKSFAFVLYDIQIETKLESFLNNDFNTMPIADFKGLFKNYVLKRTQFTKTFARLVEKHRLQVPLWLEPWTFSVYRRFPCFSVKLLTSICLHFLLLFWRNPHSLPWNSQKVDPITRPTFHYATQLHVTKSSEDYCPGLIYWVVFETPNQFRKIFLVIWTILTP